MPARSLGPDFVVVVTPDAEVVCTGERTRPRLTAGERLAGWSGLNEVLAKGADAPTVGEVTAPDGRRGRVLAQSLACGQTGVRWLLVASTAPEPEGTVAEALDLVREADAALDEREQELTRLQLLAERLVELGPATVVVDDRRRIRAWSAAAERLSGLPAGKALGRPLASVLPNIDLAASLEGESTVVLDGHEVRVSAEVIDPRVDDVLLVLES